MAKILYVIGASGAGKDSVMALFRQRCNSNFQFIHRYITRPAFAGGENHIELSEAEFAQRCEQGLFAMNWRANSLNYGIGTELDLWLSQNTNVVLNGSREYLPQALKLYSDRLLPVIIEVDSQILAQRLIKRGREDQAQINKRLQRAEQFNAELTKFNLPQAIVLNNNLSIESTVDNLQKQLKEWI